MFASNVFRSFVGLAVCSVLFLVSPIVNAQEQPAPSKPSDPVALASAQKWLDAFGDDVYHCKWEYDAERLQDIKFENGTNKLHVEGEWSFSAKLGSSYTIQHGGVEYIIREVEGNQNRVIAFWPEELRNGQKFRMNSTPSYNNAFPYSILTMRGMFYPCVIRWNILSDQWKNPCVFALDSMDSDKIVLSIDSLRKDRYQLLTLQTNDGMQMISEKWGITKADPDVYKMYRGAEGERVFTNVRVNNVWLPVEATYNGIQEGEAGGDKLPFETSKWKIIGQYTVDKDTSKFQKIDPPDGTLFYDEFTYKSERIGKWTRPSPLDK
jgi:hypothetical protein